MFTYTALGDSITAGYSASSPLNAYPELLTRHLCKTGPAVSHVVAYPGWTSTELAAAALSGAGVPLSQANAITIWTGGNDLVDAGMRVLQGAPRQTVERTLAVYGQNIAQMVSAIRRTNTATRVVLCTQYNPFPNSPIAVQAVGALNDVTTGAAGRLGVSCAHVHAWFAGRQGQLIAGYTDGRVECVLRGPMAAIHPNDAGHAVIARGLRPYVR